MRKQDENNWNYYDSYDAFYDRKTGEKMYSYYNSGKRNKSRSQEDTSDWAKTQWEEAVRRKEEILQIKRKQFFRRVLMTIGVLVGADILFNMSLMSFLKPRYSVYESRNENAGFMTSKERARMFPEQTGPDIPFTNLVISDGPQVVERRLKLMEVEQEFKKFRIESTNDVHGDVYTRFRKKPDPKRTKNIEKQHGKGFERNHEVVQLNKGKDPKFMYKKKPIETGRASMSVRDYHAQWAQ